MKYLVMEIQKFADGKMSTPTYAYDTSKAAESKYCAIRSSAAVSSLPVHSVVFMNETGYVIESKSYSREEEPESVEAGDNQ